MYSLTLDGVDIFEQQGSKKLLDTSVSMELNSAGSCEFTMPLTHPNYDSINLLTQTLEIIDKSGSVVWYGRPSEITVDFYKQKKVYFEGPLSFFGDTIQRPQEYPTLNTSTHTFFADLISNHNSQVSNPDRRFVVGNITIPEVSIYRKTNYETTLDCLKKMCVDAEGGYIMFRREEGVNYIDWYAEPPVTSNQPITYAVNLSDLTQGINCDEVFSCLIPLGDEINGVKLNITEVNSGSDFLVNQDAVALYGYIYRVEEFEGFSDTSVATKNKLKDEGNRFLTRKWEEFLRDRLTLEISAADLGFLNPEYSCLQLGKKVRVVSNPHGVDQILPITQVSFSFDSGVKDVTVGTPARQNLSEIYYGD